MFSGQESRGGIQLQLQRVCVGVALLAAAGAAHAFGRASNPTASGPSTSSLNPRTATADGKAFTLTVRGSGFSANSTIQWNGAALPTRTLIRGVLQATVPANLLANGDLIPVTVTTGTHVSS